MEIIIILIIILSGICDQYEDYTNTMYADITEGQSYTIDITLGDCSNLNYSSGGKVFIDWNIDGDFNDPGEEVGSIPYGVNSTASIPITVPYSGIANYKNESSFSIFKYSRYIFN